MASMLLFSSCKKDSDSAATTSANGWKIGTSEFTTMYAFRITPSSGDPGLTGWDRVYTSGMDLTALNSWAISFKSMPVTNGTYTIVAYPSSGSLTSSSEAYVTAYTPGKTYVSTGVGNITATVTVNAGKITVKVPQIPMLSTAAGVSTFSGTLVEM